MDRWMDRWINGWTDRQTDILIADESGREIDR